MKTEEYIGKNKEIIWKQLSVTLYPSGLDVPETYVNVLTWTSGAVFPIYGNLQLGLIVHVQRYTPSLDTGLQ